MNSGGKNPTVDALINERPEPRSQPALRLSRGDLRDAFIVSANIKLVIASNASRSNEHRQ